MAKPTSVLPLMLSFTVMLLSLVANALNLLEEKKLLNLQNVEWNQQRNALNCALHNSRREKGTTILEMKHRDYCYGKIVDWNMKLQKDLILDELQVKSLRSHIRRMVSGNKEEVSDTRIPLTSGVKLQTLNYIVTMELGGRNITVIVDTGSDLTWIQCQPCRSCYNQKEPLYNPSMSSSYQMVLCNSSTCQSLLFATGYSGACGSDPTMACNYIVSYGDGSYTGGDLGRELLHLGGIPIKDFIFGCGRNNKGLFGGVSGLMGLGRSSVSLVSQSSSAFGGIFSYCLPSLENGASGSLVLGGNFSVYKNSTPIYYTRMITNPQLSNFYFLNLTGISVGGVNIKAPSFGRGGILIDSGTVITRLPPSMYKAVKAEFLKQFPGFPSAPGFSILDTCFNLSAYQEVNIPTIRMYFEGEAELNVDVTGIFYFVKVDASQVCLALTSLSYEDEIGIIANYQQRNQRIIYDTKQSKLGIASEACSFP